MKNYKDKGIQKRLDCNFKLEKTIAKCLSKVNKLMVKHNGYLKDNAYVIIELDLLFNRIKQINYAEEQDASILNTKKYLKRRGLHKWKEE